METKFVPTPVFFVPTPVFFVPTPVFFVPPYSATIYSKLSFI